MEKSVSEFTLALEDAHEAVFQVTEQACQSTQIVSVCVFLKLLHLELLLILTFASKLGCSLAATSFLSLHSIRATSIIYFCSCVC